MKFQKLFQWKKLFISEKNKKEHTDKEFMINVVKSCFQNQTLPTWAAIRSLISTANIPIMQTGFLPFIPHPVTDYSTVYTAMHTFLKVVSQLQQDTLPLFCDEGVFRIVVDIYIKHPDEFSHLLPMLGAFHMAKVAGKYIKGSGFEDALVENKVFGVKVMESVLNGKHYVRSLRGLNIITEAILAIKWEAFWKSHDKDDFRTELNTIESLVSSFTIKDQVPAQQTFNDALPALTKLREQFSEFSSKCSEVSEVCRYWDGIVKISHLLRNLIACDRDGDWEGHLQVVQDLLPIFRECDSINYLRYASWYLEKMRKLPEEHPYIYV